MKEKPLSKFSLLIFISLLLSILSLFMAGPFLRVAHRVYGSKLYWTTGIFITALLASTQSPLLPGLVGSIWIVMGIYEELEIRGFAGFMAGFLSLSVGTLYLIELPMIWSAKLGIDLKADIEKAMQAQFDSNTTLKSWIEASQIDTKMLLSLTPGIIMVLLLLTLAFGLIMDKRLAAAFNLKFNQVATQIKLLDFKVPNLTIWVLIVSFLFSFMKTSLPITTIIGSNVLIVLVGVYFFQGLAILETLFLALKAGFLIRMAVYFLIVGQLFFLLSFLGIIDYWLDFRGKIRKRKQAQKNNGKQNGEHL